jgi:hypothetical protein
MKLPEYDTLHKRGRALEEAFFAKRDQQLLEALRRRLTAEEAESVLAAATGVADQIVIQELADLGAPQFLAVLGLFPLVEVAWCDGQVAAKEREAILAAAADMGLPVDSPSHKLLDRWLETRPAENALSLWSEYVQAVGATLKPETVAKLKRGVMGRAKKIAQAAGGILGMGNKISATEQACLDRLAKAFEPPAERG